MVCSYIIILYLKFDFVIARHSTITAGKVFRLDLHLIQSKYQIWLDYSCILANASHTFIYHGLAIMSSRSISNGTCCPTKPVSTANYILTNTTTTVQLVCDGPTVLISCVPTTELILNGKDYACNRENGTCLLYMNSVKFYYKEMIHLLLDLNLSLITLVPSMEVTQWQIY